jgi:hypothetical protein
VLYYDFESPDSSADNISSDVSGNGRDGTLSLVGTGAFAYVADAPTVLAGTQSLLLTEDSENTTPAHHAARLTRTLTLAEFDVNGDFTVSMWFKRAADSNDEDFLFHLGSGDGFGGGDELYVYGHLTGSLTLHNYAASALVTSITSTAAPRDTWHHVAVVHDNTANSLQLYLNGVSVGLDSSADISALAQGSPLVVGGHTSTTFQTTRWFDGHLDDFALYNIPLSPDDVGRLASGESPLAVPEPSTLALLLPGLVLARSLTRGTATRVRARRRIS